MTLPPLWPVFDGHNDLLLNLWLQHDDDPVAAFYSRVTPGHLDFSRMRRGGFCGGLFAVFIPRSAISPRYATKRWTRRRPPSIRWQLPNGR